MADSTKYNGSTWEHSLRKFTTATEAVENPLYSDGTAITAYTLKGNTVQTGTPGPQNPVIPNGVGVRTENLFDTTGAVNGWINYMGVLTSPHENLYTTDYLPIPTGTTAITQSYDGIDLNSPALCFYDGNKNFISGTEFRHSTNKTFAVPNNAIYFRTCYRDSFTWCMINTGSTAKPYEPYGYKIPISSGGVTTNIDLGSTQTVRAIKKLVLTGQEDWKKSSTYQGSFYCYALAENAIITQALCSHATYTVIGQSTYVYGTFAIEGTTTNKTIDVFLGEASWSVDDFKAYLQAQTANGTPVTVWYVLSTPETAIVNEPLMKIGTYADTLSNAVSIPTAEGANSITVDTTVQPSEFTATWTGWHNASVKGYDGSQWNE